MSKIVFYKIEEVAEMLRLSVSQVYALINSGRLRCHRLTTRKQGGVRVSQAQLDDYLRSTESEGAPALETPALRHLR